MKDAVYRPDRHATSSVRRLISMLTRSNGLVDQIFFQCLTGNAVNAVASSVTTPSITAATGKRGFSTISSICSATATAPGRAKIVRIAARTISALELDVRDGVRPPADGLIAAWEGRRSKVLGERFVFDAARTTSFRTATFDNGTRLGRRRRTWSSIQSRRSSTRADSPGVPRSSQSIDPDDLVGGDARAACLLRR